MVSPSRVLQGARRLPLTTKSGHNYYKGTRSGAMGRHTKHGDYEIEWAKVRSYPTPVNFDSCTLKPFVSRKIIPAKAKFGSGVTRLTGQRYFDAWKLDNASEERAS